MQFGARAGLKNFLNGSRAPWPITTNSNALIDGFKGVERRWGKATPQTQKPLPRWRRFRAIGPNFDDALILHQRIIRPPHLLIGNAEIVMRQVIRRIGVQPAGKLIRGARSISSRQRFKRGTEDILPTSDR
jgi:hypothetical protein